MTTNTEYVENERRKGEEWGSYKAKVDTAVLALQELEREVETAFERLHHLRETFDAIYAVKLVERIVFAACALVLVAILTSAVAVLVNR